MKANIYILLNEDFEKIYNVDTFLNINIIHLIQIPI